MFDNSGGKHRPEYYLVNQEHAHLPWHEEVAEFFELFQSRELPAGTTVVMVIDPYRRLEVHLAEPGTTRVSKFVVRCGLSSCNTVIASCMHDTGSRQCHKNALQKK